jgi:cell wall-associated NlpC family hydrolase
MPIKNLTLGLCTLLASTALAHDNYRVRNGDFDWAIARRHSITVSQLHRMNPGVNWNALRVGLVIHVPGSGHETRVAETDHTGHHHHASSSHMHRVAEGENDWIIAHKAGVRLNVLKELNPGVKLSTLQPGQKIRVPGSLVAESSSVHVIRSTRVAVTGDNVTIRRGPSTDHDSICTVDTGTHAAVLDRRGEWYQLEFPKGTVGWVRGDFLKAIHVQHIARSSHRSHHHHESYVAYRHHRHHLGQHSSSSDYVALDTEAGGGDSSGIIERAKSMRGTRYRWGEASRSGTDCSGFTSQVFRSQGIKLPRTSREQAEVGKKVDFDHLKAGDLVFFHTVRGHRVGHVGIYIGHGQFIHASSAGGQVQVNSISGYYAHRLVGARRVVKH